MGSAVVNSSNSVDDERIGKAFTNFRRLSSRVCNNHYLTIKLKKLRCKDVIKPDMAGFQVSPHSWETPAASHDRWRASLNDGYSFSVTNSVEKMEKRGDHRRQRRNGP